MEDSAKTKKSALGRGLGALIPEASPEMEIAISETVSVNEIRVDWIESNPYQPRTQFDEENLSELIESIRQQGIITPITVRKLNETSYQLIAGERRLLAARKLGLKTIPAFVRTANNEQMLEWALVENIQREDLNPIEIALACQRLMDECSLTLEAVGEKVGKKRSTINNYVRLLKLPPEIQAGLRDNKITMGHAKALLSIENPIAQIQTYNDIIRKELSVRQVEQIASQFGQQNKEKPKPQELNNPFQFQIHELQRNLSNYYGTKVNISTKEDGKGEIRLSFYSVDDLNRLLELLQNHQRF